MKQFCKREISAARQYALDGGQALHVHNQTMGHPVFSRYAEIAHLFDQNKERLVSTAKSLGVNVIKIDREDTPSQHIDLCGQPFERAKKMCERVPILDEIKPFNQLEIDL